MCFASDRILVPGGLPFRLSIAILLSAIALGAQAQNKCAASGLMGGEKFTANNCATALHRESVAIWFNENPISAKEAEAFQISGHAEATKDGKRRTLVQITFCPGGGAATASAAAVKSIELITNHARSPVVGIEWTVKSQKDFKLRKLTGEIKPGGTLVGKIVGRWGKTTWDLDFDVKLPAKEASTGMGCGK